MIIRVITIIYSLISLLSCQVFISSPEALKKKFKSNNKSNNQKTIKSKQVFPISEKYHMVIQQ